MVVPVPDSGVPAALVMLQSGILLSMELLEITILEEHLLNQPARDEKLKSKNEIKSYEIFN